MKTLEDVELEAMQLSLKDRATLVQRLLVTLDPGDYIDAEELWIEADRI